MPNKSRKKLIFKMVTILAVVAIVVSALYIMAHHLGLVDGYGFGAGSYYYADIPDFDERLPYEAYHSTVPTWVHIVLFLAWGWLMWRLWVWVDGKINKNDHGKDNNA